MVAQNSSSGFLNLFKSMMAKPPVSRAPTTQDAAGTSGTELYAGYFNEEYLSKLLASEGIKVYDQMRRSDGQVAMLLRVVKNPIKSARRWIEPASDDPDNQERAAFIEHILFNDIGYPDGSKRKSFGEFISEALTFVEFGFSVFEIVHKQVKGHPTWGDYLGLKDIGFRHQRSILEWVLRENGSIDYIRQLVNGDLMTDAAIPGQHLLVFSNDREGDNYEGISMLRPCYGAYFRKNIYRKLQAVGIERAAKGVPIGKMPIEALGRDDWETQRGRFQALIDKLSAHEKNGIVTGPGYEITELKITHDSEKVQSVINSENVEMSKSFLANFMELGLESNGGSYALGSDLSDIFLSGIEFLGQMLEEQVNSRLIVPLINAKFGPQEFYPKLKFSGINDKAGKETAEVLTALNGAGLLQASDQVKAHIHQLYSLPAFDPEIEDELQEKKRQSLVPPPDPNTPDKDDEAPGSGKAKKKLSDPCCGPVRLDEKQKKDSPVSAMIEAEADGLSVIMRAGLKSRADMFLTEVTEIVRNWGGKLRRAEVLKTRMPDDEEYADALRQWTADAAETALSMVLAEIDKTRKQAKLADTLKNLPKKTREKLLSLILLTAGTQDQDIEKAVFFTFVGNFEQVDDATTASEMKAAVDRYFEKNLIEVAALNMAAKVVNTVRNDVFHAPEVMADIESFIFMNPAPVTLICQSLVGRVFSKEEYASSPYLPPLHYNCKSYIMAQTAGEAGNKGLTPGGLEVTDEKILRTKNL